jgi:hypothetical protein
MTDVLSSAAPGRLAPASAAAVPAVPDRVDPRGQRFAATLTALVLAAALVSSPGPLAVALVAWQLATFGVGALVGPAATPYALLFKRAVRPRLGAPRDLEDAAPPQFAQGVGLGFAAVALVGYAAGVELLGTVAVAGALGAAFLNAAFGYCLGCETYLLFKRTTTRTGTDPVLRKVR